MIGQNQTLHLCLSWCPQRWERGCKGFACKHPTRQVLTHMLAHLQPFAHASPIARTIPGCDRAMVFPPRCLLLPIVSLLTSQHEAQMQASAKTHFPSPPAPPFSRSTAVREPRATGYLCSRRPLPAGTSPCVPCRRNLSREHLCSHCLFIPLSPV